MIPVFEPIIDDDDIEAVVQTLKRGEISGTFGESIPKFESAFAHYSDCEYGVAVNSGSTALHLVITALALESGSEVLVSANTNIASALAIHHNNLVSVPVDSELDTWNMDLSLIEGLITPKTKAIMPVHIYGHPVNMEELMLLAKKHNLHVIEDCAEAHGATINGRKVGSFGVGNCFSLYANKIITSGEGGIITTNDKRFYEELRLLRNLAFTQPRFYHEKAGFNFRMTGMQGALALSQFHKIETFIEKKRVIAKMYNANLSKLSQVQTPAEKEWARNVYWMYAIVLKEGNRDQLMKYLKENGVDSRTFFCPMDQQPFLNKSVKAGECNVAGSLWANGLYLPSSCKLTQTEINTISDLIRSFFNA